MDTQHKKVQIMTSETKWRQLLYVFEVIIRLKQIIVNVVYAKPHGNHKAKSCNRYTKIKRKEAKYSTRENHQIIKGKRRKEQRNCKNYKTTRKQ